MIQCTISIIKSKKEIFRKVPVIQINDETPGINESLICMELINEKSCNKLMTKDPISNAKIRLATKLNVKLFGLKII